MWEFYASVRVCKYECLPDRRVRVSKCESVKYESIQVCEISTYRCQYATYGDRPCFSISLF